MRHMPHSKKKMGLLDKIKGAAKGVTDYVKYKALGFFVEGTKSKVEDLKETASGVDYHAQYYENMMRSLKTMLYSVVFKLIENMRKEQSTAAKSITDKSVAKLDNSPKADPAKIKKDPLSNPAVTHEHVRKRTPEYFRQHGYLKGTPANSVLEAAKVAEAALKKNMEQGKEGH